jgi:NTP pyrophosphatase (non-canonical NTP hydrolase)
MNEPVYVPEYAYEAFESVRKERGRQSDKWGEQNHLDLTWLAILSEEVGEAAQEILTAQFGSAGKGHGELREEVVHVAAVALAWIEALDRKAA